MSELWQDLTEEQKLEVIRNTQNSLHNYKDY